MTRLAEAQAVIDSYINKSGKIFIDMHETLELMEDFEETKAHLYREKYDIAEAFAYYIENNRKGRDSLLIEIKEEEVKITGWHVDKYSYKKKVIKIEEEKELSLEDLLEKHNL